MVLIKISKLLNIQNKHVDELNEKLNYLLSCLNFARTKKTFQQKKSMVQIHRNFCKANRIDSLTTDHIE
jgi:hypothetical protein